MGIGRFIYTRYCQITYIYSDVFPPAVSFVETEAVAGGVAMLSCNITPPVENDLVYLVIWYKEGLSSPIYR